MATGIINDQYGKDIGEPTAEQVLLLSAPLYNQRCHRPISTSQPRSPLSSFLLPVSRVHALCDSIDEYPLAFTIDV